MGDGAGSREDLIAEWRPQPPTSPAIAALWLAWGVGIAGLVTWGVIAMLSQGVGTQDWVLVAGALFIAAVVALVLCRSVRTLTARLELRPSGLTLVTYRRSRVISWSELARTEIEDVEFPLLRGRGPVIVLHLADGSSRRAWGTENWDRDLDRRIDTLNLQVNLIREARRSWGEGARGSATTA